MAEAEHDVLTSPEYDDQTKSNKKKLRKRKRPNKTDHKQEDNKNSDANIDTAQTQTQEEEEEEQKEETKTNDTVSSGIMSTESFTSLELSEPTSQAITYMGFQFMTQVTPFPLLFFP